MHIGAELYITQVRVKIVIDGMGGDHAPAAINEAVKLVKSTPGFEKIEVIVTQGEVMRVEDDPMLIRDEKRGTSMGKAFALLKSGEADAMVSAGSTAALVVGGSMLIGRIKGVKRAALAPIMPSTDGNYILLDGGSNTECRPEMLLQFAIMGSIYMEKVAGVKNPRVGLLNIGTEPEKGRELELETHKLLKEAADKSHLNFVGNVEAREVPLGACDVIITDGFTGNIFLKTVEGMGGFMKQSLRNLFGKNAATKMGYIFAKSGVLEIRKKTDYREVGGAPLLGTSKPVIKAHGSSDALAFKNAIRQAIAFAESNAIEEIQQVLKK
jgi:glycerol-3-phosphate acyltransferase PlsX